MKIRKHLLILFIFLFSSNLKSQEGLPIYTDYLTENYYLLHPAMAGVNLEGIKIRLSTRKYWLDQTDAPSLQTLAIDTRISDRSGVGMILFKDQNGYNSQTGLTLTYGHHINFNARNSRISVPDLLNFGSINQLSFGVSVGVFRNSLDQTSFDQFDISGRQDPLITLVNQSSGYYNMDLGLSYVNLNYFAHLTLKNLLLSPSTIYGDEVYDFSKNYTSFVKYVLSAGYMFFTDSPLSIEPSFLFFGSKLTGEKAIDLNIKTFYELRNGYAWLGFSYRNSLDGIEYKNDDDNLIKQSYKLLTPIFGINLKRFVFSYNYSLQQGDILFGNGGFHQITLGYNFDLFN